MQYFRHLQRKKGATVVAPSDFQSYGYLPLMPQGFSAIFLRTRARRRAPAHKFGSAGTRTTPVPSHVPPFIMSALRRMATPIRLNVLTLFNTFVQIILRYLLANVYTFLYLCSVKGDNLQY